MPQLETTFATELRRLRLRAQLTLEALAEASGVSVRTVGALERGQSLGPQRRTVLALADGLALDDAERQALEQLADVGRPRPVTAPGGWCVPPRPVADFTGRDAEVDRLVALAAESGSDESAAAAVAVLSGPGGVGKTTLAVEAGRRAAAAAGLPLLYVDLRGMDPEPLEPAVALFRLLKALGVGNRDMPDDLDSRSGQFRTLLEQRPAIVVLDNVRDEEQVRPLLPGGGVGSVFVASRRLLTGLEGVERLAVPILDDAAAQHLLTSIIGDTEGPRGDGLEDLAALCGGLPLALRIIGNRLATRPRWTARQLADRLGDSERRLEQIHAGDLQITAAFAMSYDHLTPAAQRLCRRAALVPGPDFAAPLASTLIGASVLDTEELLDELHELGLLSQTDTGRYGFHDLIRLFAGDRLDAEEPGQREPLAAAMTDWLLTVAVAAGRWFEPSYGAAPADWDLPVDLSSAEAASAWLQDEADNWFGAVRIAASEGKHRQVIDTAEAVRWYSDRWFLWTHWHELFVLGVEAADRLGDTVAQAKQLNYLSWAQAQRHEHATAAQTALRAAAIAETAGAVSPQAWAFLFAANAEAQLDLSKALRHAQDADRLFAQSEDYEGRLNALQTVGMISLMLGQADEGIEKLREGVELARVPQDGPGLQLIADVALLLTAWYLARAYEQTGTHTAAEDAYRLALTRAEAAGTPYQQAKVERGFALLLDRTDRRKEAATLLRSARERFAEVDAAEEVAEADALLAEWG
ncbi:XRE family transcriptional regulator [Catenulispora rubra]|uniref:XRE family transcriptional regulator n=1 Tax=Catenulispora rubra TaxID=280293 RepID=UPI001892637F|nr:XRE family transcriptional regulator [Catenulispora rubra]